MNLWKKIASGCAALSPSCGEAARAQSEALDHPLPPARRFGLGLHLLVCRWCRRHRREIRFLRAASLERPEALAEAAPAKLSEEARERMRRRLAEESE